LGTGISSSPASVAGISSLTRSDNARSQRLLRHYSILNPYQTIIMVYPAIDPAQICRAFFTFITVAGIGACAVPALREYGPRSLPTSETRAPSTEVKSNNITALDRLAKLQVPHTWFTHFYIVAVASSAFWAYQLATYGAIFRVLASRYASHGQRGMTMNQILITWVLMALQGSRRLYESVRLLKPSTAQMPLTSYALGIAFYLAVNVAVWAEGMRKSSWAPSFTVHVADPRSNIIIQQSPLCTRCIIQAVSKKFRCNSNLLNCLWPPARLPRLSSKSKEVHVA
jgi:3-oxo-5-alpha-steroid 4-dehydrogenase 3